MSADATGACGSCEAGRLDTTGPSCLVDLGNIPDGLDAGELEQYHREHNTRPSARESYERLAAIMRLIVAFQTARRRSKSAWRR